MAAPRKTVAMLAPMVPELAPLKKKIPLHKVEDGNGAYTHEGMVGDVRVIATMTGIGTKPATDTTERLLAGARVDHVMVVGVAGGMGPTVNIGDLVLPASVIDEATGKAVTPHTLGSRQARGTLVTSDKFGYDKETTASLIRDGCVAVDMETSSIGLVCEAHGVPWSAYRAISDRGDDDTVDIAVLEMGGSDGTFHAWPLLKYLFAKPWQAPRKMRHLNSLRKGSVLAFNAAADAAIAACADV